MYLGFIFAGFLCLCIACSHSINKYESRNLLPAYQWSQMQKGTTVMYSAPSRTSFDVSVNTGFCIIVIKI